MIAEVLAVGTELLLGQIVNTNAARIGTRLAEAGIDCHHQVTVGDNVERISAAIHAACTRADALIVTGGIGPTQDDVTKQALAAVTGASVIRDEEHAQRIRDRVLRTRGHVPDNTLRMADALDSGTILPNRVGLALGAAIEHEGCLIVALPGVPSEMAVMLEEEVLPLLRARAGGPAVIKSRVLKTWGYGEAQVATLLDDLYQSQNPTLAFQIEGSEVRVRVTAKAETHPDADAMIEAMVDRVAERLGSAVFGHDDDTIASLLVTELRHRDWRVGTVETASTLGMVGAQLGSAPGGDAVFAGSRAVVGTAAVEDERARALELLAAHGGEASVTVAVSELTSAGDASGGGSRGAGSGPTGRYAVAVRTPSGTHVQTMSVLGDAAGARPSCVAGALHLLRLALTGSQMPPADGQPASRPPRPVSS